MELLYVPAAAAAAAAAAAGRPLLGG